MSSQRWQATVGRGLLALTLLVGLGAVATRAAVPSEASAVEPVFVAGNPSCGDAGYSFSLKVDPPSSGTYTFSDGVNEFTLVVHDGAAGPTLDWSSTLPLDVVIVKGGPNANVYTYDPEAASDTGLHAPMNPNNGQYYGLSHVEICYDYEVSVEKTAETTFTRTWHWNISKSVDHDAWQLFAGGSASSEYTVGVVRSGFTDSDWAVSGAVTITNATPLTAVIAGVTDQMEGLGEVALDCGVTFPYELTSGATLQCTYAGSLPDGEERDNTASVATTGVVGGGEAHAGVVFGAPTTVVDGTIDVTDTNGSSWGPVADSASWTYSRRFTCSSNPADYTAGTLTSSHPNTATIVQTGQSDDASVTVSCYAPVVGKTAATTLKRTFHWSLDKVADRTSLVLSPGQVVTVTYEVTAGTDPVDSDWKASGTITVRNPNPAAEMTVGLTDVISPDSIGGTLDCGGTLTIPAGGTGTCGYEAWLPDASDRTNTATAVLNGIPFTGSAAVSTTHSSVSLTTAWAKLTDDRTGELGTVCAADAPHTYTYTLDAGPYQTCGEYEVTNTASYVADDTGGEGNDTVLIPVSVPCDGGCTLTPGYWKTHSVYGPAPYDETWAQIGEDAPFFTSGQSFYQVLWTPPKGNAYYILAHAYIAARLNLLNGAAMPAEVSDALAAATDIFAASTPEEIAAMKGRNGTQLRAEILGYATMLDDYNNGLTGPGHCSE